MRFLWWTSNFRKKFLWKFTKYWSALHETIAKKLNVTAKQVNYLHTMRGYQKCVMCFEFQCFVGRGNCDYSILDCRSPPKIFFHRFSCERSEQIFFLDQLPCLISRCQLLADKFQNYLRMSPCLFLKNHIEISCA